MAHGTVKWFNEDGGFGLIAAADGGPDLLIERNTVAEHDSNALRAGQTVEFDTVVGRKGPQARHIRHHPAADITHHQDKDLDCTAAR